MLKLPLQRFTPPGAVKVADKLSDAVAYLYTLPDGRPGAIGYHGKATKPDFWFRFASEAKREAKVRQHFDWRRAHAARKVERRTTDAKPHRLELGHILKSSWGYDQTNIEFWEVTRIVGKRTVEIRQVGQISESTGWETGRAVPDPGHYIGEPKQVLVTRDSVRVHDCARAYIWEGRPASWSSYH